MPNHLALLLLAAAVHLSDLGATRYGMQSGAGQEGNPLASLLFARLGFWTGGLSLKGMALISTYVLLYNGYHVIYWILTIGTFLLGTVPWIFFIYKRGLHV